MFRKNVVCG